MPNNFIDKYNLRSIATKDGYVYAECRRGMYELPQSGILAQRLLEERLAKHGYAESTITHGFATHLFYAPSG